MKVLKFTDGGRIDVLLTRQFAVAILGVMLLAVSGTAQSPNGTINGLVLDPTGRPIAGAGVLIVNDATRVQYPGKSNDEGIYVVSNLPPGSYRVQISKVGFKTIIKPEIVLNVQDALSINFTLPVGARSETITVQGGGPLVNTESASVSTVIDRDLVSKLPLNGRSFNTLLQLTPGVVIAAVPASGLDPGQFSIAGQRTDANNFTVDGVSANFGVGANFTVGGSGTGTAQAFSVLGGTSSLVSVDALQEFRIETSSFAPEFGRSPGGQVILTTRSGTNDWHGGLFEYFRNTVMDANDWFANQRGLPRAAENHNDFGGFLGGPIIQDKTFFFFSYEGARLRLPQNHVIQVPSLYAREQAGPSLAPFLNAYPLPNGPPTSPNAYIAPLTASYSNSATLNATSLRIDHTFNERVSIFGRFNYAPSYMTQLGVTIPNNPETLKANTTTFTVGINLLFNNRMSDTLRANYSTQNAGATFGMNNAGGAVPIDPQLLLSGLPPPTSFGSFQTFDTAEYFLGVNAANRTRQWDLVDDFSWTVGTHLLKFGGDYRSIQLDEKPFEQYAALQASTVQQFLATGAADLFVEKAVHATFLTQALSLYAQDVWKVSPRLTLTYGLRWEMSPAPSAEAGTTLAAWTNIDDPANLTLAPAGAPLWRTTYTNFAPRFGVAYALNPSGDFVLRLGGGIFYDLGVAQAAQLGSSFPNFASSFVPALPVPVADATPYLPVLSRQPPYPDGTQGFSPNLQLPRSYQWNLALEKSFGNAQSFSMTYLGQAGRSLLRQQALYQPNANFAGDFLVWGEDAFSNYNAVQLQYRRPVAKRIQALVNYSWSHSLDNASNDSVAAFSDTVISGVKDYASSSFDVRQSFSGAVTYAVPGATGSRFLSLLTRDWSIDGVMVARTGFPFNAVVLLSSPDPAGFALSRPDLVLRQPLWIANPAAGGGQSLNPAAFVVPSAPRQGNEPRNDIPGFGLLQIDLSLARKFPLSERVSLQFRVDAFNILNHPNFTNPPGYVEFGPAYLQSGSMLNQGLGGLNPLFQEGGPRSLQLSLKLSF
jgi:hypothetical protein